MNTESQPNQPTLLIFCKEEEFLERIKHMSKSEMQEELEIAIRAFQSTRSMLMVYRQAMDVIRENTAKDKINKAIVEVICQS